MPQGSDLQILLSNWDLTPDVVVPTAVVLALYATGLARRPGILEARLWRHAAFFWGVMAVFLSLASPLDALADRLFFMHQVQHMLIRLVGPMLIALAQPQGLLIAGMPSWLRRNGLSPVLASRAPGVIFGFLTRPVVATVLFVGALYLGQWPRLHNLAILSEGVHYVMHVTMLAAGLLFFWRVFDQRPAPKGTRFGVRLMMLWVAVLSNIPIGVFTSFKSHELYPAYDVAGRLFHMSAMDDERLGGFIMWAPSSMMMLVAVLAVIHAWAGYEEKLEDRRTAAGLHGSNVSGSLATSPSKNRALALGLGAFATCVLAATLAIGLLAVHGQMRPPSGHLASGHLDPRYRVAVSEKTL
jgi:putative membrane protein